jgi:hypothetical protein
VWIYQFDPLVPRNANDISVMDMASMISESAAIEKEDRERAEVG